MKRQLLMLIALVLASSLPAQEKEEAKPAFNTIVNTLKERINLMGYIQGGYTYDDSDNPEHNFDIKRIIFMAEGKVTDRWYLYFQYNFNSGGTLLEAYTDYQFLPWLTARAGQFKLPFTIEGPLSPSTVELINCYSQATNYLTAMSSAYDPLIGSTAGRDLGIMLYGDFWKKRLSYSLAIVNGQGINTKDKNNQKDIIGSLMVNPLSWLSVGGSFIKGKGQAVGTSEANPDIEIGDNYTRNRWGVGAVVKSKPLSLRTEYLRGKDGKVKSEGCYVTAAFHLTQQLNLIASYDYLDKNKHLDMQQTNYIGGIEYWFYPRCRVQAQYTYSDRKTGGSGNMVQTQIQVRF